jgi:hypothetical protein
VGVRAVIDDAALQASAGADLATLLRACHTRLGGSRGDTIVQSTDGVRGSPSAIDPGTSAQADAERILGAGATHTDDALVLVARYTGARR